MAAVSRKTELSPGLGSDTLLRTVTRLRKVLELWGVRTSVTVASPPAGRAPSLQVTAARIPVLRAGALTGSVGAERRVAVLNESMTSTLAAASGPVFVTVIV